VKIYTFSIWIGLIKRRALVEFYEIRFQVDTAGEGKRIKTANRFPLEHAEPLQDHSITGRS